MYTLGSKMKDDNNNGNNSIKSTNKSKSKSTSTSTIKDHVYDIHGTPPLHSVLSMVFVLIVMLFIFPSFRQIDETATLDVFTHRIFPEYISLPTLLYIRASFTILIFSVTLYSVLPNHGWDQQTNYLPSSKLKKATIPIHGIRTLLPFTSWSWNLLGISFALNTYITYQAILLSSHNQKDDNDNDVPISPWVLRMALFCFETAAPASLLVTFVVSYGIWPNIIQQGGSTTEISSFRTLLWHNMNIIMSLTETCLLGGIPIHLQHVPIVVVYGITYVFFSWTIRHSWNPTSGPQFIYFFFDTTNGKNTTYFLWILLFIMTLFYIIFSTMESILSLFGGGILAHSTFVILLCMGLCKVKD